MQTLTTPIEIDTPHGPLYVAVERAERHSYCDSERGNVTELRPFLRVASDPTFEADPNAEEHWTIRRRSYGVHYTIFFEDRTGIEYAAADMKGERWHYDRAPYAGGFRADHGGLVEFGTKTWDLMWAAVSAALDAFDAAHPGWQELSRYLLLWSDADTACDKARDLRKKATEQDQKAAALEAEAGAIGSTLPDSLMELVFPDKEN